MKGILLTLFMIGLIIFIFLMLIGRRALPRHYRFVAIFFLFYFIDNLAVTFANHFPQLQFVPNHLWSGFLLCGWSGKSYSILLTLILIYFFRSVLSFRETGISLQHNEGSLIPSAGIILMITFWSSFVGSRSPRGDFDMTTLVYLSIMPGLNEELVYRGVLPACLDRLFPKSWIWASAKVGWSTIITTVLFGLLHGLWLDDQFEFHVEITLIRNAILSGFIFAWLKERTGSLIMPIIAHGVWDFFLFLPRMI
jgi:uncharacterized protein